MWECLPGYYRAPFSATLVDCLAWDAYQMQVIRNPAAHGVGDPVLGAASAIATVALPREGAVAGRRI